MSMHEVKINNEKCIGCGICTKICVANCLTITNGKAQTKYADCLMCGQCTAVCPKNAIEITGYDTAQIRENINLRLNPDDVLNTIRFRRTVRNFKQQEITREIIEQILQAGRLTHTAKNMQDVEFVVLQKKKAAFEKMAVGIFKRLKLFAGLFSKMAKNNEIGDSFFFFDAPCVIVILAKNKTNGILAAQNMEFVAEANGLGVLYSGFFTMAANASGKIKKALQIPKGKKAAMTLVVGYSKTKFLRSAPRENLKVRYM